LTDKSPSVNVFVLVVLTSHRYGRLGVTGDNLDPVDASDLGNLTKLNVLEHKSPDVVTEPVGVQLLCLEMKLSFDPGGESVVDGLVELN